MGIGWDVEATAMEHALGGIDAPQPPLIQEGEMRMLCYRGLGDGEDDDEFGDEDSHEHR